MGLKPLKVTKNDDGSASIQIDPSESDLHNSKVKRLRILRLRQVRIPPSVAMGASTLEFELEAVVAQQFPPDGVPSAPFVKGGAFTDNGEFKGGKYIFRLEELNMPENATPHKYKIKDRTKSKPEFDQTIDAKDFPSIRLTDKHPEITLGRKAQHGHGMDENGGKGKAHGKGKGDSK